MLTNRARNYRAFLAAFEGCPMMTVERAARQAGVSGRTGTRYLALWRKGILPPERTVVERHLDNVAICLASGMTITQISVKLDISRRRVYDLSRALHEEEEKDEEKDEKGD